MGAVQHGALQVALHSRAYQWGNDCQSSVSVHSFRKGARMLMHQRSMGGSLDAALHGDSAA